jgi:rod shape determining protein RodA
MAHSRSYDGELSLGRKFLHLNWTFILLLTVIAGIGFAMLYSAANGSFEPWASRQMARFAVGMAVLIGVALIDIRLWARYAYVFYAASIVLLVAVEVIGVVGMGAQRWIDLGIVTVQPSEIAKIALILALARYFHSVSAEETKRLMPVFWGSLIIGVPAVLVLRQPDLGTALLMGMIGVVMLFLAGVQIRIFLAAGVAMIAATPLVWHFLHDYQKQRLLTYFSPEEDPLGSGYHIMQSKIAFGSGGLEGKGFLQGTQSHLNFLPEKQTDFIFTMLAEEFGMIGGLVLIGLYVLLLVYGLAIALNCRNQFGRLVAMGVTMAFMLNVFINIAMVMGMVPVVGMPLPLISYGGTAMLTLLFGFGLLMNVHVHRDVVIGRHAGEF